MKTCTWCQEAKHEFEFHRRGNGCQAKCKTCMSAYARKRYVEQRDRILDQSKSWKRTDRGRLLQAASTERARRKRPEARRANIAVMNALQSGRLLREPCHVCGVIPAQAHHPDYSRPLDVEWLCPKHHVELHKEYRYGKIQSLSYK